MKHLLTSIVCCLAVAGSAQTPVAYNPDANGDNFIGSSDLVQLLSEYGSEYIPLMYNNEAVTVPFDLDNDRFVIESVASVYIIDLRLDPDEEGGASTIFFDIDEVELGLPMLSGTEFWFLTPDNEMQVSFDYMMLSSDYDHVQHWSHVIHIMRDAYYSVNENLWVYPDIQENWEYSLVMNKVIYLGTEFVILD